jgi:hypothetical protein
MNKQELQEENVWNTLKLIFVNEDLNQRKKKIKSTWGLVRG